MAADSQPDDAAHIPRTVAAPLPATGCCQATSRPKGLTATNPTATRLPRSVESELTAAVIVCGTNRVDAGADG